MNISSRLKGNLAQAVVKSAFSHWKYRVVPFGIEETLREVVSLDLKEYKKLNLPVRLRSSPDFIVASSDMSSARLVEVKFRSRWSDYVKSKCFNELRNQVKNWGPIIVVFVFKDFFSKGTCLKCLSLTLNERDEDRKNYLEVVTANGVKDWKDVTEGDFRDLSEFFPLVVTETLEFRNALASLVSAEEVLSRNG